MCILGHPGSPRPGRPGQAIEVPPLLQVAAPPDPHPTLSRWERAPIESVFPSYPPLPPGEGLGVRVRNNRMP